nr:hypothetical protein [Ralstonia mannitolilytica]
MQLLQNGKAQFIDQNGLPLANGTVGYYAPGTLNPLPTYQDMAGTIQNTNPITLDSRGQAIIWGTGTYRQIVKDASGVTIWDQIVDTPAGAASLSNTTGAGGAALVGFDGGPLSQFFLSKNNRVVDSIAELRALSKSIYTRAFVTGYYAAGDGGGGAYYYDPSDTTSSDNGGTIIVASDGGRWKLQTLHYVTLKTFGAKGDWNGTTGTDDTTAIQNALTWAAGAGATLRATYGAYAISAAISVDTGTASPTIAQGGKRFGIIGDGKSNTTFVYTGSSNIALFTITGHFVDFFRAEGFRIQRKDQASEFGYGLTINNMVNVTLRGIDCFRLATGVIINDCNAVLVDDCTFSYNNLGFSANYVNTSTPNAVKLTNCVMNSNITGAISIIGGVVNSIIGCVLEQNGITDAGGTTYNAQTIYIRTNNPVNTNFFAALTMIGNYMEGNAGSADLQCDFRGATTVVLTGNLFNRISNTNFVTNDIVFDASSLSGSSNPIALEMSGNTFTSQGTYVASSSRRAINYLHGAAYTGFQINDNNIYKNSAEVPIINPAIDQLRGDVTKAYAMGQIRGIDGAIISNYRIASAVRNGTGDYTVTTNGPGVTTPLVIATPTSSSGLSWFIASSGTNTFEIKFTNSATGAAVDPTAFNFLMFAGF